MRVNIFVLSKYIYKSFSNINIVIKTLKFFQKYVVSLVEKVQRTSRSIISLNQSAISCTLFVKAFSFVYF